MDDAVNSLNKFFVNIGRELVEKIPDLVVADERNFIYKNPSFMFLTAVDEREI